jgi:hypothetical protein
MKQICAIGLTFWLWGAVPGSGAEEVPDLDKLAGQPAELSAWAYAYRADLKVQEKPEASFVLRRLERLDQIYRPVSLWLSRESEKKRSPAPPYPGLLSQRAVGELGAMLPRPEGVLRSALLWEGRMQLDRLELHWPKSGPAAPARQRVEVRVYPSPFGWFGWQRDQQVTVKPEISADGLTWVYRGDWNGVDMVAVFVQSGEGSRQENAVPQIRAYGPDQWERMDVEVEWGFQPGTENAEFDGRVDGFFGLVGKVAPLPGDAGTTMEGPTAWKSHASGNSRRGIALSLLRIRINNVRIFPYGHPRDTRITVWTRAGSFTFLTRDLEQGPILAPEHGFFVRAVHRSPVPSGAADSRTLLDGRIAALLGNKDIHAWGAAQDVALGAMIELLGGRDSRGGDTPWFAGNATDRPVTVSGITFPGRGVAMHPGADRDVGVGWRSPMDGRVRVRGDVAHAQPGGGDGIEWRVVSEARDGRQVLARGVIDRGGKQSIPSQGDAKRLADIAVRKGDVLTLVVGRRGTHEFDSTAITLVIAEIGGQGRTWDLARDVVDHLPSGNPRADALGNPGVWSFFQSMAPQVDPSSVFKRDSQAASARGFIRELAAANVKSVREMTREHREATWEEAMREIKLPLLPPGTTLPPYKPTDAPPMQVLVPESRWQDAWRMGTSQLRKGELTYMDLALEAPRPIHDMDLAGLHDTATAWLDSFLQRPGAMSDGDFSDGSGNFCIGRLFHNTALIDVPGYPTYELVHNGGTGRILYDLAEHYFLTGDSKWFNKNQWRMQAAAEWIIWQRTLFAKDVPNRENLWAAGLHPPQHIADCAWGYSEWKWYTVIDAWNCQGLRRFAEAMRDVDPENAARYLAESDHYRKALQKAVDRAITLSPVMLVRNGTYRSYIPPILYVRGPSIEQVVQIAMTDQDWSLQALDAAEVPAADDVRVDGHLDVCEDVLALATTHLHGGNRYSFLTGKRRARGLSSQEDWFWGGFAPQLGYSSLANVYLRRDEVPSVLRQWVNNYAAFVMPVPDYCFHEHFINQSDPALLAEPRYRNGHALAYFMEQFRNLLVWEEGTSLWLAKATPRHWLEQGKKVAVSRAPTYFGEVSYAIVSDVDHGKITATIAMLSRKTPGSVLLRFRHPKHLPMKSVTINGKPSKDFDAVREVIPLHEVHGTVMVECNY